ncbi:uncharacterized protein LOC111243940 isoform X2 [Varroa destructor]|uniref:Uncharacterized protein n=1 Tax=Varroa destructor TaxID=109461 RepID=A0A7M7J2V4_VARDE|nr:uncharacterized protein LOC111243940 isoform X2 [Varroa destructor]
MDSSPTSTLGCFGCFRKVNQRTARSYISSGYYGTNGFKYLPVNGQGHLTTNGVNGAVTVGPRPSTLNATQFKGGPPLNETGAGSPQYVSIDQASEMSRRAIVDKKRSMLYVQRTTSGTNDSGIGRSSGRELSDESFSRHQLTYANVHKSSKPLYPSILHPALQEQLSLSALSSPGGCRVPRRASSNQIAQAPRGTGTPQRSTSQRFDPTGAKASLMINNQNGQHQPPVPIHRDHARSFRSSYLSNESSETGSDENNADSTLAREMALLKLELEMVRLECESIMRQQARANSYSHLNKQHCNGRCCYHQHGSGGGSSGSVYGEAHIYDDVHTYSRGPRPAFSHNYVNVPYVTPFGALDHEPTTSHGLPSHATRFNATPIDVLRLRQRSSSASPSRFARGVSESHSMMDMPRRGTSPSPSPLVHGDVNGHHLQQQHHHQNHRSAAQNGLSSHSHHGAAPAGVQSAVSVGVNHRQQTVSPGQSYLYRPHRSCSNPAIKKIEDQPPLPPREHISHKPPSSAVFGSSSPSVHGALASVASHTAHPCPHGSSAIPSYPYKHSRSRSHGGGFQQYQNHFQQSIPTVQEQSGSSREQLDNCSDDSRSVTPVADYEGHSLPSTPGTQSPCPASEPIAGPHARRPMGTPGPPSSGGSIPQQQIHHQRAIQPTSPHHQDTREHRPKWDREREQQSTHYNSPSSNCNSPRYSRERTVDEANESMHDMMHLLAHLDETRRLQSRLQMQETLPHDPRWPINPNLNPELARDRDKLKEKIKRKRERAQKRREQQQQQQQQQQSSNLVNRTDTMSTNESEYGFLPGRHSRKSRQDFYDRPTSPETPACEEVADAEATATTPKQERGTSISEDTGSRSATPVNEKQEDKTGAEENVVDESGLVSPSLLPSPGSGLSSPVSSGNGNSLPTPGSVITALMISSSTNASPTQMILQGGGNNNGSGGLPTKDPIKEHTPNVKEVKDIRDIKDILREKQAKQQMLLQQQQQAAGKNTIADKTVKLQQIKTEESCGTVSTTL